MPYGWLLNDADDPFEEMFAATNAAFDFGSGHHHNHKRKKCSLTKALSHALAAATPSPSFGNSLLGSTQLKDNKDGSIMLRIELPGVKKENTNVTIAESDGAPNGAQQMLTVEATIDDELSSHNKEEIEEEENAAAAEEEKAHDGADARRDNEKADDDDDAVIDAHDDDDVFAQAAKAAASPSDNNEKNCQAKKEEHQQSAKKRTRKQQQVRKASVSRSWTLPANVDVSLIKAEQADGVLTVTIPKPMDVAKPQPIRIDIA